MRSPPLDRGSKKQVGVAAGAQPGSPACGTRGAGSAHSRLGLERAASSVVTLLLAIDSFAHGPTPHEPPPMSPQCAAINEGIASTLSSQPAEGAV